MARKFARNAGSKKNKHKKNFFEEELESSTEIEPHGTNCFKINNPFKLNIKQKDILSKMLHDDTKMIIIDAVWGSGKTFTSTLAALTLLQQHKIHKIFYIRNPCESSNTVKIGTLPGELRERLHTYNCALLDQLDQLILPSESKKLIDLEIVEFLPPGLIRGRSMAGACFIVDEASNLSWEDILLITSRMGEGTKMFMVGDSFQNDIGNKSGFKKFFNLMNDEESKNLGIHCFEMRSKEDIVRSGIIRYIMEKTGVIKL